jgi:hypothetical protein
VLSTFKAIVEAKSFRNELLASELDERALELAEEYEDFDKTRLSNGGTGTIT